MQNIIQIRELLNFEALSSQEGKLGNYNISVGFDTVFACVFPNDIKFSSSKVVACPKLRPKLSLKHKISIFLNTCSDEAHA